MSEILEPLIVDLVEWVAKEPRTLAEVMDTWRTSCPRLTVWEDAIDKGYLARRSILGGSCVVLTAKGEALLRMNDRLPATIFAERRAAG